MIISISLIVINLIINSMPYSFHIFCMLKILFIEYTNTPKGRNNLRELRFFKESVILYWSPIISNKAIDLFFSISVTIDHILHHFGEGNVSTTYLALCVKSLAMHMLKWSCVLLLAHTMFVICL